MLKKDLKAQIALGVVLMIMAFAITVQFKSVSQNKELEGGYNLRVDELLGELKTERTKNEELEKQLNAYQNDISQYREAAETSSSYSKALSEQLTRAELLAGMVDVKGEGISVKLDDIKNRKDISDTQSANATLIHDEDIRKVINELSAAGAEAIAVNDSRIVSTSAVRCVGPSVLINDTKMTAPYVIKAIGKADQLEAALNLNGGVIDNLKIWGFDIEIKREAEIVIPKYSGKLTYEVAKPIIPQKEENAQ